MKLIIDISKYQWNLTDAQWDIFGKILDGVIIRMSFGRTIDSMAAEHIRQCNRVGLPYIGYSWIDPISDFQGQLNTIIAAVQRFGPTAIMLDMEQYWQDWVAYMEKDYAKAYASRFTPEQLNSYYKKFFIAAKQYVSVTIGCYSSNSFMNDYCPAMFDWVPFNNYWRAGYPLNEKHYEPEEVRAYADTIDLTGCIGRQFSDGLDVTGLPGIGKLDWNAFSNEGFSILFGDKVMGTNIEMQFVSQLGDDADDHNNDCGQTTCSAGILWAKGDYISPDELYKVPGWGSPQTDIGTNSYQLHLLLNNFEVINAMGGVLTIADIKKFINENRPIIALVKYGLFSAAGLTVIKGSFNHWLIVTGYTDTHIITMDPYRPYEYGGRMDVPYAMFMSSYLFSYIVLQLGEMEEPMSNATCKNSAGVNIRASLPISASVLGTDIGDISYLEKVTLKEPIVDHLGKDGLIWVELVSPKIGWVAKKFFNITIPVTPPPVTPPTTLNEKAIRLDELNKTQTYMTEYFANRTDEINNS